MASVFFSPLSHLIQIGKIHLLLGVVARQSWIDWLRPALVRLRARAGRARKDGHSTQSAASSPEMLVLESYQM